MLLFQYRFFFFFFNDTATTEIYTLSLHDALPILWEINGTDGDLQVTADGGQAQIFELTLRGGTGAQSVLEVLTVPQQYRWAPPQGASTNVAQAYARFARDYRDGTHLCPTFDDGVRRHR